MRHISLVLTLMVLWSIGLDSAKVDYTQHPMSIQIEKINPNLKAEYRAQVVQAILDSSARHGLNPKKLFAILAQESKFDTAQINRRSHDYGIGQINQKTIKAFGFDQNRLLTDVAYSVEAAAIVLSGFRKSHAKKEKDWWTRYNSSNPEKRQIYGQLVAQYM